MANSQPTTGLEIAVVGMAGRFPGAKNVEEFWRNLRHGVESITFFTDEELKASGIDPASYGAPDYVKAAGIIEDIDKFDAAFFGYNPREAALMDPQHRLFLECAWEALENAGYDAERYEGAIGVYAGVGVNSYLLNNLMANPAQLGAAVSLPVAIGNDKDFLSTRVSYKLNLRGPAFTVQTACSTSLVATHLACQSLLNGECDLALAGGVLVQVPHKAGYVYQEGGTYSPDGHCRAFDANANGTTNGNGVAIVVLKRLQEALAAGDRVCAVIKGSAINNDGSDKVGFTAPSVNGQAQVITEALAVAGVEPETVSYIETHGTGTNLGDPIEIAALIQAFRGRTDKKNFCAIGSVKTNIGHTDAAAGAAGLIKTVLALQHQEIPPSLHFEKPNPKIDFANSPFYVNAKLAEWETNPAGARRRAGVSSFGIGGTNAHVVVEEAPVAEPSSSSRSHQLLVLSAKTNSALEKATANLAEYLAQHRDTDRSLKFDQPANRRTGQPANSLADVAFTLQTGRKRFNHRRTVVCGSVDEAVAALSNRDPKRVLTRFQSAGESAIAFMFPGQGAQYVNMGLELYQTEAVFREQVDRCCDCLKPHLGFDLRRVLYPPAGDEETATQELKQTYITQPALFVMEYAMAQLWMDWGVRPQAMIGHSIGEYVAACLAEVFSLDDALMLVAKRGRMMQNLPGGAMLAVPLPVEQVEAMLNGKLSLAAINEFSSCVVSGPNEAVNEFEALLAAKVAGCRRLQTSHAFHSAMMDEILDAFVAEMRRVKLQAPKIPYLSNVTGAWITAKDATEPNYYARHLRQTVRFAEGVKELLKEPDRVLLEVGPGRTLSTLAESPRDKKSAPTIISSMRHPHDQQSDAAFLLKALGKLWLAGAPVDWSGFYANEKRRRVALPTYPFERQRCWIAPLPNAPVAARPSPFVKKANLADWFYLPSWKRLDLANGTDRSLEFAEALLDDEFKRPVSSLEKRMDLANGTGRSLEFVEALPDGEFKRPVSSLEQKWRWLIFANATALCKALTKRLQQCGHEVFVVNAGENFARLDDRVYQLNPHRPADYEALLDALAKLDKMPERIVHLWGAENLQLEIENFRFSIFYSLVYLAQALAKQKLSAAPRLAVVTSNVHEVTGEETLHPEQATVLALCHVIPQEFPGFICRNLDVARPESTAEVDKLIADLVSDSSDHVVAYRGKHRWVQTFEPLRLTGDGRKATGEEQRVPADRLRPGGVYLITGGLGHIGLKLAEHFAKVANAKLVLTGRSRLPARNEWESWLATHGEDDVVSQKLRKVQALEKLGSEVLAPVADAADLEQMQAVIGQTYERFGALHGVIHAAGIMDENAFQMISALNAADCERHFQPKINGLHILEKVLAGKELDFCMLLSSLSSVLGGIGYTAYAAANIFMDAFTHRHNQIQSSRWISVNWDGWEGAKSKEQKAKGKGQNLEREGGMASEDELVITPIEGVEVFDRILSVGAIGQIVVSTGDLPARIERWIKLEALPQETREVDDGLDRDESETALSARAELSTAYVAPRNEVERAVSAIWQELLGMAQVGVDDNFFELGGHSLLAIQVIGRLRQAFQMEISVQKIFEAPTVAELAAHVEKARRPEDNTIEKMAQLLQMVEGASEEEVQALLAEKAEQ